MTKLRTVYGPGGQRIDWTFLERIDEGKRMGNCVGGYVESCIQRISYIYIFSTARSTIEDGKRDGVWHLYQHYGPNNYTPR
jgi:hypothetical protein